MSREIREYGENLDSSNGRDIWEGREGRPLGERPLDEASFGGESEEAFLGRIRRRMRRAGVPTAHPGSDVWPLGHEERWRYPLKAELFVRTLEALGGHASAGERSKRSLCLDQGRPRREGCRRSAHKRRRLERPSRRPRRSRHLGGRVGTRSPLAPGKRIGRSLVWTGGVRASLGWTLQWQTPAAW